MNLAASEALGRVRSWERKKIKITGMVLSLESELIITLNGRVRVCEEMIVLTGNGGCGLQLKPLSTMELMYNDAVLDIRGLGWRCVLYEPSE